MVAKDLEGKSVGLDTAPLIYFMEQNSDFYPKVKQVFERNSQGEFDFVVSVLTLTEVLIYPLKQGNTELAFAYRTIFEGAKGVVIAEMSYHIAIKAAELRAKYTFLRTPDAIQLATALHHQCDLFFSNDEALKKVTDIQVFTINDWKLK